MNPEPSSRSRTLLAGAAVVALLVLAWFALRSIEDRESETRQSMIDELHDRLEDKVATWEAGLLRDLDAMLAAASDPKADPRVLQQRWRRVHPWFDALYIWNTGRPAGGDSLTGGAPEVVFRFPARIDPPDDPGALGQCTEGARSVIAALPAPDAVRVAKAWIDACPDATVASRTYVTAEASQALRRGGLPAEALQAMHVDGYDDDTPLSAPIGVPVARRLARRVLLADLQDDLGQQATAFRIRQDTVAEALGLDAPELESTLYLLPGMIDAIERHGGQTGPLHARMDEVEQRLAAYREIRQTGARPTGEASEAARFTYDQYSDAPYLLYSRRTDRGTTGIALQLRQDRLLQSFLRGGTRFDTELSITDVSGRSVAGAEDVWADSPSVTFTETLRHLSASVGRQALDQRLTPAARRASTAIVLVTLLCLFMVSLAIAVQVKANALYRDLLQRQREFTARVTHELKTPLAGIRVMAENLASGAYRDEKQAAMMAQRIIDEADRLTVRVNEVLAVARKREIEDPKLFDLEEPMLELVDMWGPRYEQAGIRLIADLAPVDPFLGDAHAIRDAVGQLLDNALKYRREGADSQVWLNVIDEDKTVVIEVVDNGMGVPEDQRKRIFEQFARVEGPNRGKSGGHGLGLSQVAEIVRAHGGTVLCEDGVDGGTRFVVRLPARRPRAS